MHNLVCQNRTTSLVLSWRKYTVAPHINPWRVLGSMHWSLRTELPQVESTLYLVISQWNWSWFSFSLILSMFWRWWLIKLQYLIRPRRRLGTPHGQASKVQILWVFWIAFLLVRREDWSKVAQVIIKPSLPHSHSAMYKILNSTYSWLGWSCVHKFWEVDDDDLYTNRTGNY